MTFLSSSAMVVRSDTKCWSMGDVIKIRLFENDGIIASLVKRPREG
jgi:hypothetical protein